MALSNVPAQSAGSRGKEHSHHKMTCSERNRIPVGTPLFLPPLQAMCKRHSPRMYAYSHHAERRKPQPLLLLSLQSQEERLEEEEEEQNPPQTEST